MKNLLAGVAFAAFALLSTNTMAQYYTNGPSYVPGPGYGGSVVVQPSSDNHCTPQRIRGTPYVCVINQTPFPIVSMSAHSSGFNGWFTGGTNLLRQTGIIMPGRGALVRVSDGGNFCSYNLYVTTQAGVQHTYYNLDVCRTTDLFLPRW